MSGLHPSHLSVCPRVVFFFFKDSSSSNVKKISHSFLEESSPSPLPPSLVLTRFSQEFLGSVYCSQIDPNGGTFFPAVSLQSHKVIPHSLSKTNLSTFSPAPDTKPKSITFSYLVYVRKTAAWYV